MASETPGPGGSAPSHSGLRDDFTKLEIVPTDELEWTPSPSPGVERKRLERSGPAESGRVTSLVRYAPESEFPEHPHPGGEELFVLEGVFSDASGDHPAGTYLLNPEGYSHAPRSAQGCVLFVKLRQAPGARHHVRVETAGAPFEPYDDLPGVSSLELYAQEGFPERVRLVRFEPGTAVPFVAFPKGEELFGLEGELEDEHGRHGPRTWLRFPPGGGHAPRTVTGCLLLVKKDHLGDL
jgi:anti-sigma factor ChrR (cupin superfamily)